MFSQLPNLFRPKVFEEVTNSRLHVMLHGEVERLLADRGFEAVDDLKWVRGDDARDCQEFRVWACIMGGKENDSHGTQERANNP